MRKKVVDLKNEKLDAKIKEELERLTFTKNLRSATAEEWYVFLQHFHDPQTKGAAGKVIIQYDLQGNRDVFIHTTIIYDDPKLFEESHHQLVYSISDELVNRLVGYANTLLSVHAGANSYQAEYIR
ncbi:hypothetical protein [Halalkalibacter alkalisediminis]|uniref:Uncharacterized protein n=1 Tax=Halalkalibacter alkalisediminis TaxID=935616 RepID=A0ABV6NPS7_9BACI|nr:hypothetical protein [Halalkalibacter alkalisediminis]